MSKASFLTIIISALSTLLAVVEIYAEPPQMLIDSIEVQSYSEGAAEATGWSWNLTEYFKMEDPKVAAQALREHALRFSLPLNMSEQIPKTQSVGTETAKTGIVTPQTLIHVFNGTEFTPNPGVEGMLLNNIYQMEAEARASEKVVCVLQFRGEMSIGDVIDLLDFGGKVYGPLGRNAIIVRLPANAIDLIRGRSWVRWIGNYRPEYKYSTVPSVSRKSGAFIYPLGGDESEYRTDLQQLGISVRGYDIGARMYDVIADASIFPEIAELWWVKGVLKDAEERLEEMTDVTVSFEPDDSRELIMAYNTSYTGSGVLVGVRDNAVFETHPELSGIFHSDSELSGTRVHGTHVTGIIAGRTRTIDGPWGSSTIRGVAYGSTILFRDNGATFWDWVPWIESYTSDFDSFRTRGVQISNHSYHIPDSSNNPFFGYDGHTQNFDAYCDNDDMVIIKSAGNQSNPSTITNPGTGKNVIAVGAIYYVTDGSDIIGERASYSSQGPTADDSRLKPELVAPGGDTTYTRGVVATNSNPWNIGGSSRNIDGNYTWPEWQSDDNYIRLSGTSMAAPHVTGICAKIKQWNPTITSEIMKAILVNTAIPLKVNSTDALGGYANTQVGYGMVNGFSVTNYYAGEYSRLLAYSAWLTEDNAPLYTDYSISVPSGSKKLMVTLAYNDQEGEASNSDALNDDMDLILISPSGTYYYAYAHKAQGVTNESPLEKMIITNPAIGNWTVRVRFSDSPGFGNPFIYAEQRYGVHAAVILKTPALNISVPDTSITINPGQTFNIQPTVTNTGGYIAAGVTLEISGPSSFGGDINTSRYVGNLMYENASTSTSFELVAPSTTGTYTLTAEADGINQEFSSGYPKIQQITVTVQNPFYSLSDDSPVTFSGIPKNFSFAINSSDWCCIGINPGSNDHDIKADNNSDFSSPYASSAYGGTTRDFVVTNGHSWGSMTHYAQVYYGSSSNYTIEAEWSIPDLSVGAGNSDSISSGEVHQMYEVPLANGQEYQLTLDITSGSADLAVYVFKSTRSSGRRGDYDWQANSSGAGGDESLTFTADSTGDYGIAVINENASSASYTLTVAVYVPPDTTPPDPDPMTWETEPYETSTTSISMTATSASDSSTPIYYQFDFYDSPTGGSGGSDRDWNTSRSHTDSGLQANHQYGYRVRARDSAPAQNPTSYSSPVSYDYTDIETPSGITFGTITNTSIQAQSSNTPSGLTRGSSGLVIYNVTRGTNSGWKQNNNLWTSGSLSVNTQYEFKAQARNGDGNPTGDSPTSYKYTLANAPGTASFSNVTESSIQANWTANGNPGGTQYYCENTTRGTNSGWTPNTYWNETDLDCDTEYCYQVKAKNGNDVETIPATDLGCQSTLPCPVPEINIRQGSTDIPDDTGSYDFGSADVGMGNPVTFTIENLGNADLDLSGAPIVEISGAHVGDFVVTQQPSTPVIPANPETFEITFSPSDEGLRSAAVSISNNDSDENPYNFSITGIGILLSATIYVDDDATAGANNGLNWDDAFVYLQDALSLAANSGGVVTEIRVAQGTYTPDQGVGITAGDREATFQLLNGVALKGGYFGIGAADPNERDISNFETILSGDLNGDDGPDFTNKSDNSYHVITSNGCGPDTVLSGFVITNGTAKGSDGADGEDGVEGDEYGKDGENGEDGYGGGMYCENSNFTISNCVFRTNTATGGNGGEGGTGFWPPSTYWINGNGGNGGSGYGSGLYFSNSSPTITKCIFIDNIVRGGNGGYGYDIGGEGDSVPGNAGTGSGGGIYCDNNSRPMITNCFFNNNNAIGGDGGDGGYTAPDGGNGYGGGIYSTLSLVIANCTFNSNSVTGGIGGSTWIAGSGDGGTANGGGLYCTDSQVVANSLFFGNSANGGDGGVDEYTPGNGSDGNGGGLYCINSQPISNCTFYNNVATGGAGWQGEYYSGSDGIGNGGALFCDSSQILTNSILWDNIPDQLSGHDCSNVSYCDIQDGVCEGINGNISLDPLFADPANGNYHLLPGSPCIDAGDSNDVPTDITTDLDGRPRFVDDILTADTGVGTPPIVDMGAYEFGALYVYGDSLIDPELGTPTNPFRRIQDAIDAATGYYSIRVAAGAYEECITVNDGISLYGGYDGTDWYVPRDPNANKTFVDGQGDSPVVAIIDSSITIDGFVIQNGSGGYSNQYGGGIYCVSNTATPFAVTISNNIIQNNGLDRGYGAGIYCDIYVKPIIVGNIIQNNAISEMDISTAGGGGIYCAGTDCEISGNVIVDNQINSWYGEYAFDYAEGGGIWLGGGLISDNTVSRNSVQATGHWGGQHYVKGGGIYCDGPATITRNSVEDNVLYCQGGETETGAETSEAYGGGIWAPNSTITFNAISNNACEGSGGYVWQGYEDGANGYASGGGIYAPGSFLSNNVIADNSATGRGGNAGDPRYVYTPPCSSAGGDGIAQGGGIYAPGANTTNNTFARNQVTAVGGQGQAWDDWDIPGIPANGLESFEGGALFADASTIVSNSIMWNNAPDELSGHDCSNVSYCDVSGGSCSGINGNIGTYPLFADPNGPDGNPDTWEDNDYHVKSQFGRWDPNSESWVYDDETSPCIDAGDPNSDWTAELWPHGKRINMGVYGGTAEASMSLSDVGNIANLDNDAADAVDFNDLGVFLSKWCYEEFLLAEDLNRDGIVNLVDYAVFVQQYGEGIE